MNLKYLILIFFHVTSLSSHQLIHDYWPLLSCICLHTHLSNRILMQDIFEKIHNNKIIMDKKVDEKEYLKSLLKRKIELGYDCAIFATIFVSLIAFIEIEYAGNLRNGYIRIEDSMFYFYKAMVRLSYFLNIIKMGHIFYNEFKADAEMNESGTKIIAEI